jgi:hypothetical protein
MWTSSLMAGVLLLSQAETGNEAKSAARAELEQTVRTLVKELDAPERAKREAAEHKLLELGAPALEVLPEVPPRSSAELKQRLDRVRAVLEMARAEAFVKSSLVTLSGEYKLSEIFAELEKQTGNKILDYREEFGQDPTDPEIKVAFDKTPFWSAFDQVLDDAELTTYGYADQSGLAVVTRSSTEQPRAKRGSYSGAFRFEPIQLTARRGLRDALGESLRLQIEIAWEPRLAPLALKQPLGEIEATGNGGAPLSINNAEGELEAPLDRGNVAVEMELPFDLPPRDVTKIATLKGRLTALVPGGIEQFRFTDLENAKQVEQHKAGVSLTLDQVRKNNAVWEVRVRLRFDNRSGPLESHRNWLASADVYLEGEDGKPIPPDAMETTVSNEEEIGMAYLFDRPQGLAGLSLVYQAPAVILTLPVEYELKDLELP